ncbi:hypothetical protein PsYK624_061600 [Phanerochaete sordida]|uniref:Uncharacterized protein n=1 Tax=Phanerochaete sordida TaxID=48140 RepID=A0A9P3LCY2_9APHY|nr:hypothetical protein PsYK624_061600 [Phanerochaete sordida]
MAHAFPPSAHSVRAVITFTNRAQSRRSTTPHLISETRPAWYQKDWMRWAGYAALLRGCEQLREHRAQAYMENTVIPYQQ